MVDERLKAVNTVRLNEEDRPPLLVRWIHEELQSNELFDEAVDLWNSGPSLLIIDSLSTWDQSVRNAVGFRVPQDWNRTSVLWLPPFGQQTGGLDDALDSAISIVPSVRTAFRQADASPIRTVTHDPISKRSLSRWLHRVLHWIGDPTASDAAAREMKNAGSVGVSPRGVRKPS